MRNPLLTWSLAALAALAALAVPLAVAGAQAAAASQISEFTVAGIKVIHKPVTANDVVAVRLFIKGGAAALTPAVAGIEHVLVDAATSGTEKYSKDAFSALATSTGTEVGGAVTLDYTSLSMLGVRQHFNDAWDLFTQAALHPTFPETEVQQVKEQIVNQLKQRADDPDSYLSLVADSLLYDGHPYAVDPQGNEVSVSKLTRDDLLRWHKRRMTKENLLLVVVGNVSRAQLEPKVASAFGGLPATGGAAVPVPAIKSRASAVSIVERQLPTNYIMGVYAAPGRASPDYPAIQMATRLLGERLFEEVRTKRNLTYAVGAGLSGARQSQGNLYVTAVEPDTTMKVIFSEVRRMQRDLVDRARLQETINVFVTGYWMGQETNGGQAGSLGNWELTGGGWRNARLFVDRMKAVTAADIKRVASQYLKNARFVVIGDPKKIKQSVFTSF
jgi:zinc protease